jgi:hypothetical protein
LVPRILAAAEAHRANIESYRDNLAARKAEQLEHNTETQLVNIVNIVQIALYAAMPTDIQQLFMSAMGAIDMDTPRNMLHRIEEAIGPATTEQLHVALAFLHNQPYAPPADVNTFIERLDAGFILKQRAGFAFCNYDKIEIVKENFAPCGIFALTLALWDQQYPIMADQTYQSLKTAIIRAAPALLLQSSSGAGYASAVASAPSYAALQKKLAETEAKLAAKSWNGKKSSTKLLRYCWTHGTGTHGSSECDKRKEGHIAEANYRNQMGGTPATSRK